MLKLKYARHYHENDIFTGIWYDMETMMNILTF